MRSIMVGHHGAARRCLRSWLLAAWLCAAAACGAGWHRPPDPEAPLGPPQQAQVRVGGRATQVHAVVLTADTVFAIPLHRPIDRDSCRVAWPSAQVDSIRIGNPVAGFWKTVGLVVGIPGALLPAVCAAEGGCPSGGG